MHTVQFRHVIIFACSFAVITVSSLNGQDEPADVEQTDSRFNELVQQRIRDWQPTKDERLLDQIGWASDLVEAKRLAKTHEQPLFVFTYSGSTTRTNAIALRRC